MMNLQSLLCVTDQESVTSLTKLRFKQSVDLKTPEALILYEQRMLDNDKILELCTKTYVDYGMHVDLKTPIAQYIQSDLLNKFAGYDCVPIQYSVALNTMLVGVLPEREKRLIIVDNINIHLVEVPLHYYVNLYTKYYGQPDFLLPIPITEKASLIINEAISLGASDITISSIASGASVYYNVRLKKVHSSRQLETGDVANLVELLSTRAGSTIDLDMHDSKPRYFGVSLDIHHRGRVVVNKTYYGYSMTIRVLSNEVMNVTLEDLNIRPNSATFIRSHMLDMSEPGLRVIVGATGSGKNTTTLAAISELVSTDKYKIISLEQPVEILVDGIEQINAETDEEFAMNADSLLRSNPDLLYFTEITARTAEAILQASNTGKVVFTSLHANSVSDVFSRLIDITGMSLDRLIITLQSCVFQRLVRDDERDSVYPENRCVHFTRELKYRLYGKSLADVKKIIEELEVQY